MTAARERLSARTDQSESKVSPADTNGHALPLKQPIRAHTLSGGGVKRAGSDCPEPLGTAHFR